MGEPVAIGKAGQLLKHGPSQTILMGDGGRTLIFDDDGPALAAASSASGFIEVLVNANTLRVDPESTGAVEILVLPDERRCAGMPLFIRNTGGEAIGLYPSGYTAASPTTIITTVQPGHFAFLECDGTAWNLYINDALVAGAYQSLSGAGAVNLTTRTTLWTTTGAQAGTLADGTPGQRKRIVMISDGGDGTLTPATMLGANTTITFNDEGDAVELEWVGAGGWAVISNQGCTLA